MTHNNPKTYPRLATPVAFVEPDDLLDAAAAVVQLHRDHGDRGNRRHARLKYVIAERGEDWARERLSEYLGKRARTVPRDGARFEVPDHLGWHEQGDGSSISACRSRAAASSTTRASASAPRLREIVARFRCDPILMPSQDIILSDISPADRAAIEAALRATACGFASDMLPVERWALACPALPTCGLALTEAERVRDDIVAASRRGCASTASTRSGSASASPAARMAAPGPIPAISALSAVAGLLCPLCRRRFRGHPAQLRLVADKCRGRIADALDPLFALFRRPPRRGRRLRRFLPPPRHRRLAAGIGRASPGGRLMLPITIDAHRVHIVLVGAGAAVTRRLARLDEAGADWLEVYSPAPEPELAAAAGARLRRRLLEPREIAGAQLFFVAGLPGPTTAGIAGIASSAGILVNVEDDAANCDFHSAAVVHRGDLMVAVSTNGRSPGMAAALRQLLERMIGPEWGARLDEIAALRRAWRKAGANPAAIGRWTEKWADRQG